MRNLIHTVRFRLTVWYAASLSLVLAAFGGLLYGAVRYQLLRHHDSELRAAAAAVAEVLSEQEDCVDLTPSQRDRLDLIGQTVLFHEIAGNGRLFYRSPDSLELAPEIQEASPLLAEREHWFETLPDGRAPLRIYAQSYTARSGRRGLIRVMHRLGDIVRPLATLRLALALMAPLAVALAAVGGYWLAVRALAPVDEVTRMAREIGASSLSRRLPSARADDEIGRLIDTFNQMISRLEASFEGMKRFTADASHELRRPLATMRGAIDVALSRPREAEEYRRVLASVGEDVDQLRSISEDLLVLARADKGRIVIETTPVRLDVVAGEVVESFAELAAASGVSLSARCESPVVVFGDERWLRQLVFNLLENAIKFSGRRPASDSRADGPRPRVEDQAPVVAGAASVTLEVAELGGEGLLRVADTGPGIPEQALPRIFERFYRADGGPLERGREGAGLGVAIAAWIVEAHGGSISVANRPEGGSVFSARLLLARS